MGENKILNLYPIDYPFETLVDRVVKKKLVLDPDFQRKYKWDKDGNERASRFIESCLMRIPLPACYLAERDDNTQEVIDGVQRITTIINFFNDQFALEGLSIFTELEGKKFSELEELRSELETTTIRCIVLRKDNKKELVKEIFARLNQGAVELTPQEIRHAVYPGGFDAMLTRLAEVDVVKKFKQAEGDPKTKDGREPDEMVLRFFALNTDLEDYDNKLARYLDQFMKRNSNADEGSLSLFESKFVSTLEKCLYVFGDDVFTNPEKQRRQSIAIYDLLMWSFSNLSMDFVQENKDKILVAFRNLCSSVAFDKTMSGGLQQKSAILTRRRLWMDELNQIIGDEQ